MPDTDPILDEGRDKAQVAPSDEDRAVTIARRGTQLFLATVIGVSFVGLVVGLRQGVPSHEEPQFERSPTTTGAPGAIPAATYREFDRRTYGPNSDWQSNLASLHQPEVDLFALTTTTEEQREHLIRERAERRAFDGAPPTIPHPADQMTTASCLACHATGLRIQDVYAPRMSHARLTNCTQCHVEQHASELSSRPLVLSQFVPLESPGRGTRAWEGAPPTIPHSTFMREDCMSCHGPNGPEPIRTSHPWQISCVQCHAPSAVMDQSVFDAGPFFLPPPWSTRSGAGTREP